MIVIHVLRPPFPPRLADAYIDHRANSCAWVAAWLGLPRSGPNIALRLTRPVHGVVRPVMTPVAAGGRPLLVSNLGAWFAHLTRAGLARNTPEPP